MVIRRYTLLGGLVALTTIALYMSLQGAAVPFGVVLLAGVALGSLAGWMASRRDAKDTRHLQKVIESLSDGDHGARARLRRRGQIGDLARAIDTLGERLSRTRKKRRRQKDRLRTILDAMAEAVMVTDADGYIGLTNEVLTELVGFDPEGKTATEAIRHPDLRQAIEDAQLGVPRQLEISMDAGPGRSGRVLHASVSPLRRQRGVVTVFHDVTAERAAERVRRDFVANAGHELRTPLTAIRGFAETLREGGLDDPESAKDFIEVILRHTKRLEALVDDLADLSRFESDELELELGPVSAEALVHEVTRGLEAQTKSKRLTVTCSGLEQAPPVIAEQRALEQILVNLVDNAIKYTPEGGEVRIDATSEDGNLVLEVANSGPGIPAKHLDRVFERFYRVDAGRSRELGGTGLGLSIVKHLVANIGAGITVESAEGWTRFRLRLACADSPKSDTDVSRA